MKSVKKILDYQKTIVRILTRSNREILVIQSLCLDKIGHIACYESYLHAISDLLHNDRVKKQGTVFVLKQ